MKVSMSLNDYEIFQFDVDEDYGNARSCYALLGLSTIPAGLVEAIEALSSDERIREANAATQVTKMQSISV